MKCRPPASPRPRVSQGPSQFSRVRTLGNALENRAESALWVTLYTRRADGKNRAWGFAGNMIGNAAGKQPSDGPVWFWRHHDEVDLCGVSYFDDSWRHRAQYGFRPNCRNIPKFLPVCFKKPVQVQTGLAMHTIDFPPDPLLIQ